VVAFAALLFFRDFPRQGAAGPDELLSPADGTVVAIETLEEIPHYDGAAVRISIFMSVFNVHVNRAPFDGVVREVRYAPGAYKDARDPEASRVNESSALWLETERGPVTVRQISGAVARRIVCRARPGMGLKRGEKFGMIKFGSRVELYLPPGSQACVPVGAKTKAGLTILARFP
jgi:phosphatidylserine decarboxylase